MSDEAIYYYGLLRYSEVKKVYFIDDKILRSGMVLQINIFGYWVSTYLLYQKEEDEWIFTDQRFSLAGFIGHEIRFSRRYLLK